MISSRPELVWDELPDNRAAIEIKVYDHLENDEHMRNFRGVYEDDEDDEEGWSSLIFTTVVLTEGEERYRGPQVFLSGIADEPNKLRAKYYGEPEFEEIELDPESDLAKKTGGKKAMLPKW